jgi:6-phosphogluconolactonase/glucosamine-6-phosphate isomerase/deaminase
VEPIPLAPDPLKPRLPGQGVVREDADRAIDAAAADLYFQSLACVRAFGDFHLALGGGPQAEPLYRRLMYDPGLRELPWKRTHLWLAHEHAGKTVVDDDSVAAMIAGWIVEHSDIPREQVHFIDTTAQSPQEAYEAELRETLGWREKGHDRLDFVALGLEPDGTAGPLVAGAPLPAEPGLVGSFGFGRRLGLSPVMLSAARFIGILATGTASRATVARLAFAGADRGEYPVLGVRPLGGELRWYLDAAACPQPGE